MLPRFAAADRFSQSSAGVAAKRGSIARCRGSSGKVSVKDRESSGKVAAKNRSVSLKKRFYDVNSRKRGGNS